MAPRLKCAQNPLGIIRTVSGLQPQSFPLNSFLHFQHFQCSLKTILNELAFTCTGITVEIKNIFYIL